MFDMPAVASDNHNEGYIVTTGVGPDLMEGAKNAVRLLKTFIENLIGRTVDSKWLLGNQSYFRLPRML